LEDADQRFGAYVGELSRGEVDAMARRLKVPKSHHRLAGWIADWADGVARWRDQQPEVLYRALSEARAFHPDSPLVRFLAVVESLKSVDLEPLVGMLDGVSVAVTPAKLQARGLAGAELGRALDEARVEAIAVALASGG
ncbi:MAG: hypothetical protein ACC642_04705, partial [Pseudomonadales bacterium]